MLIDRHSSLCAGIFHFPINTQHGPVLNSHRNARNTHTHTHGSACRHLKTFLISFALAWIQQQKKITLDAKYKLPKMHYKGDRISAQFMRMDKQLVKDMGDVVDPKFPLMTKRRQITVPKAPTASTKTRDDAAQAATSSGPATSQQAGVGMSARHTSRAPSADSMQSTQPASSQGQCDKMMTCLDHCMCSC